MVASLFEISILKYIMIYGRRRLSYAHLPYLIFSSPILYYLVLILIRHSTKKRRSTNRIVYKDTPFNRLIIDQCPSFRAYTAPSWLPGPHFNTLFAAWFRKNPHLQYTRTLITFPDEHDKGYPNKSSKDYNQPYDEGFPPNGTIRLDWHGHAPSPGRTILLILHGLTGGSDEAYVQHTILAAEEDEKNGGLPRSFSSYSSASAANIATAHETTGETVTTVVMNARGCGGSTLSSPRCFSAAWTEDVRYVVRYLRSIVGSNTPIVAVGFSLGAGILSKYVAEEGEDCELTAAVACCASFDLNLSSNLLETFPNNVTYNPTLAGNLRKYLQRHVHHFQDVDWLDVQKAQNARTVRQFDASTIVPMFNYRNVEDYYTDASSGRILHQIKIPFLMLNSIDDPICAVGGISEPIVRSSNYCVSVQTKEGGHVAWCQYSSTRGGYNSSSRGNKKNIYTSVTDWLLSGLPITRSWDNDAAIQFLSAVIRNIQPKVGGYMNDSQIFH